MGISHITVRARMTAAAPASGLGAGTRPLQHGVTA